MRKLLFFAVFFLISLITTAQSNYTTGYIIKNNGDSIVGLVNYSFNGKFEKICQFKRFEIAGEQVYKPGMIKAYGFRNGRRFESKKLGNRVRFYECILKGPVNLYARASDHNDLYVQSARDGFVRLLQGAMTSGDKTKSFRNYKDYLAWITDTDIGTTNIAILSFSSGSVAQFLQKTNTASVKFNQTVAKNFFKNYSITKTSPMWQIGFTGGYQYLTVEIPGNISTSYFKTAEYNSSYRPAGGIYINRRLSRRSDMFSFELAAIYFSDTYSAYAEYHNTLWNRDDIMIEFSSLQIPASFRFEFGKMGSKIRPVIKLGAYTSYVINSRYTRYSERNLFDNIYYDEFSDFKVLADKGLHAGAGVDLPIGSREIGIEVGFSHGWQDLQHTNTAFNTKIISNCYQVLLRLSL